MTEIVPAILTNDISDFRKKYSELLALTQHFKKLHIDFIDGEFIKNKTVMPKDLTFLKNSPVKLMAHFMAFKPQDYFRDAKAAGFNSMVFHYEAFGSDSEVLEALAAAQNLGLTAGLAVNPETPLHKTGKVLKHFNFVQLMGVHPGDQGRDFVPEVLNKVSELKNLMKNVIIAVDGGIRVGTARQCAQAGADMLIAGSAILRSENEEMAIEVLQADVQLT